MMDTEIERRYRELLGFIPENIRRRTTLAALAGQEASIQAIEQFRETLIHHNPLDRKTQQLVHLAMLLATGSLEPARLHAKGALKAGASPRELYGVCETAAIVGGMPGFSQAVDVVYQALEEAGLILPRPHQP